MSVLSFCISVVPPSGNPQYMFTIVLIIVPPSGNHAIFWNLCSLPFPLPLSLFQIGGGSGSPLANMQSSTFYMQVYMLTRQCRVDTISHLLQHSSKANSGTVMQVPLIGSEHRHPPSRVSLNSARRQAASVRPIAPLFPVSSMDFFKKSLRL